MVSIFGYFDESTPISFSEELTRIIVNDLCENFLNGPLSYLKRNESFLGRFIDGIQNPSEDVSIRFGATKDLGNSTRRSLKSVLVLSQEPYEDRDGENIPLDIVSQIAYQYIESAVNQNGELIKEIDKYIEICNTIWLTYFDSYVAELRTKL